MKTYNIDYFYPDDILFQLAKLSEKPVMYIRADGPKNCKDEAKLNEIWEFYYGKCDSQILSGLQQNGEVYCYFMTIQQAMNAFHEWFPQKSDLDESEMDYYVYVNLLSVSDDINVVNGL